MVTQTIIDLSHHKITKTRFHKYGFLKVIQRYVFLLMNHFKLSPFIQIDENLVYFVHNRLKRSLKGAPKNNQS